MQALMFEGSFGNTHDLKGVLELGLSPFLQAQPTIPSLVRRSMPFVRELNPLMPHETSRLPVIPPFLIPKSATNNPADLPNKTPNLNPNPEILFMVLLPCTARLALTSSQHSPSLIQSLAYSSTAPTPYARAPHTPINFSIISAIKSSISQYSLSNGQSLHALTIKIGLYPQPILSNHLLNFYSKSHRLEDASKLFDEMPERNLITYSTLISSNSRFGDPKLSLNLMTQLPKLNIAPNQFVFSSSIAACSKLDSVILGEQIHAQVIVTGFEADPFVCTSLIDLYSKVGSVDSAVSVFRKCTVGDSALLNSMVSCYVSSGDSDGALVLLAEARRCSDFKPTEYSFSSLIKACSSLNKETGKQLHGFVLKAGLESNCVVGTSLVDMYGEFGDVDSMEMVFDSILLIDIALYNAMIVACLKNALEETALDFLCRLIWEGLSPNECTFSSALKACCGLKSCYLGAMIHGLIEKSKFREDLVVNTALTDMYMKCSKVEKGCKLFDRISERSTVSYNSMISGHGHNGNFDGALGLFIEMKRLRKNVDISTFVALLSSCRGREWHVYVHAIKHGFRFDPIVQNALLDGLLKKGSAEEALEFFDKMKERNVVSWTTMISGLTQLDQYLEAIKFFKAMNLTETNPNSFTLSSILKACGNLASLDQGRCIHASITKHGIMDDYVKSSLLDMYSKCGVLKDSRRLFNCLASKDIVSWNTMITAYAKHGDGLEAISLYNMMAMHNIDPNHVTFVSLLSGCSHCGLVEEGIKLFELMVSKHGIEPLMEHYACMVDLFGRLGMLERARDCIFDMPFEADASVWAVLLAACKLHGNVEIGQMAKDRILGMKGEDNPTIVIMSNMYSGVGKWDYAEKARRKIGVGGAGKQPGFSWV